MPGKFIQLRSDRLIPLYNEIIKLLLWLRPGALSLKVARIKAAFEKPTTTYSDQRERMIDELVLFEPEEDGKPKKRRQRPHDVFPNVRVWDFGDRELEFEKRDKELRETEVEVYVGALLTEADLLKFEKERIEKPVGGDGKQIAGVDFTILYPICELKEEEPPARKPSEEDNT